VSKISPALQFVLPGVQMFVDELSGQVSINPETSFYPKLQITEFTSRRDIDSWEITVNNGVYKGLRKNLIDYQGAIISVHAVFLNSYLRTVSLSFFLAGEKENRFRESNYPNSDIRRHYLHDAFLRKILGDPPYNFDWGFIALGSDVDSFSAIFINYFGNFLASSNR